MKRILMLLLAAGFIVAHHGLEAAATGKRYADREESPVESTEGSASRVSRTIVLRRRPATLYLHLAVRTGNAHEVEHCILAAPHAIDFQDTDGNTALHLAAAAGNLAVVGILIANMANVVLANKAGKLAVDMAREAGHSKVVVEIEAAMESDAANVAADTILSAALANLAISAESREAAEARRASAMECD